MPRLFIGLEIPDDIRQTLSLLRGGLPGARWIDPENYHLTLRFIGDIEAGLAHEIVSMLGRVNRRPFDVRLDGLSSFGGRKPRAIVVSVAPSPSLAGIAGGARAADAARRARSGGTQIHPACHARAACAIHRAGRSPIISRRAVCSVRRRSASSASCFIPRAPRSAADLMSSRMRSRSKSRHAWRCARAQDCATTKKL